MSGQDQTEREYLSPGASLLIPLILGSAILCVAAIISYRYVENQHAEDARKNLAKARDSLQMCLLRMEHKEYEESFALACEAVERVPDLHTAYFFRAKALIALHKDDEAIRDLTKSMELNPNPRDLYHDYFERARAFVRLGRDKEAEDDFTQALRQQKYSASAYKGRALVRKRLGNLEGYESDLAQAQNLGQGSLTR